VPKAPSMLLLFRLKVNDVDSRKVKVPKAPSMLLLFRLKVSDVDSRKVKVPKAPKPWKKSSKYLMNT